MSKRFKTIKFPTRIKWSSEEPYESFYKKCLKSLKISLKKSDKICVDAFAINPKDQSKLSDLVMKSFKKQYPRVSKKKLETSASLHTLGFAPVWSDDVEEGFVRIDMDNIWKSN
jgi:hypothetical protein